MARQKRVRGSRRPRPARPETFGPPPALTRRMKLSRDKLNRYASRRGLWPELEPEPEVESAHFYTCKACGQAVDKRPLGDVFHHEGSGHEPIPTNT
jgi:hypothetical protein